MSDWQPIETAPDKPMPVLLFARDMTFWSIQEGVMQKHLPNDSRGERWAIGYWDGREFCYSGSNHACFEGWDEVGDPQKPTHWVPLQAPPVT